MALWDKLPKAVTGWITIAAAAIAALSVAYGLGATTSDTIQDIQGLPGRMTVAEGKLILHDSAIARLQRVDSVSQHNRESLNDITDSLTVVGSDVRDIKCYLKAQADKTDPAYCLSTLRRR